jgi:hypothetical protein
MAARTLVSVPVGAVETTKSASQPGRDTPSLLQQDQPNLPTPASARSLERPAAQVSAGPERRARRGVGHDVLVAVEQSADEMLAILGRLHGQEIATLQVLGINTLNSVLPLPEALVGETVTGSDVAGRTFRLVTVNYEIAVDLQRTGKVAWVDAAQPYRSVPGSARPTVRLLLASGTGLDLREPAKTKRITVMLANRAG